MGQKFGQAPKALRTMLSNIITNNEPLLTVTNPLLEVYRHDVGWKEMAFIETDIVSLVSSVLQQLTPLAEKSDLSLQLKPTRLEGAEGKIHGDSMELRRFFTNLIGNAIKFTDEGSITVRCSLAHENASGAMVKIGIQDNGRGIPPNEQRTIFERYRQGDHMRAGSGLSLHLAHCIVRAYLGKVAVRSEMGEGSVFKVLLLQHAPPGKEAQIQEAQASPTVLQVYRRFSKPFHASLPGHSDLSPERLLSGSKG